MMKNVAKKPVYQKRQSEAVIRNWIQYHTFIAENDLDDIASKSPYNYHKERAPSRGAYTPRYVA
jgi:hypothetical protein